MTARYVGALAALVIVWGSPAHAQCVAVVDDKAAPSVAMPEVDVRQLLRPSAAVRQAMQKKQLPYAYLEITRLGGTIAVDGAQQTRRQQSFIRMFTASDRLLPFTFSQEGLHRITVYGAARMAWPEIPDLTAMERLCTQADVDVYPRREREDFPGVRGQWWTAYRIPTRVELGTALFVKRIGVAAIADVALSRAIGDRDDPNNLNPIVGVLELRYRGARGHIGAGVRYYPDEEVGRDHWRATVSFADELPSFKGRPIWLLFDLTLEERGNFLKGLRPSFGIRFDLWGSRP